MEVLDLEFHAPSTLAGVHSQPANLDFRLAEIDEEASRKASEAMIRWVSGSWMGMACLHYPKVTASPCEVQTGMNWMVGKKQDKDWLFIV